jgi:hypothetical protein
MLIILEFISKDENNLNFMTIYDAEKKPAISIRKYANRLYKYIIRDPNILAFAMYYLSIYINNTSITLNQYNIHRLFLTASSIAHKFWCDNCYENKALSKIGGIKNKELNALEKDFLHCIDWGLYKIETCITYDEFAQISTIMTGIEYNVIEDEYYRRQRNKLKQKTSGIVRFIRGIVNNIIYTIITDKPLTL